jgi:myo-inositol-1(or 4)-monophosphatase
LSDLSRIAAALAAAGEALAAFTPGEIAARRKVGGSPVTEADQQVDDLLREMLPTSGEGWLSEETVDSAERLACSRVWVVDPLDGTKEFVEGLPEWCVSIGLVEDGVAIAGGILNPATGETILGGRGQGVTLNGQPAAARPTASLAGAEVLASRSEVRRGQWEPFQDSGLTVVAMGSVAYKLARVAAGLTDATWTLVPKNEWDIAAGVALVEAAGGVVRRPDGEPCRFNRPRTLYPGLIASGPNLAEPIERLIDQRWPR